MGKSTLTRRYMDQILKNFNLFPFEVEGCGEFAALEEEDENPEKSGLEKFGLELIVEYPEKDEFEVVLEVGLLGCTM